MVEVVGCTGQRVWALDGRDGAGRERGGAVVLSVRLELVFEQGRRGCRHGRAGFKRACWRNLHGVSRRPRSPHSAYTPDSEGPNLVVPTTSSIARRWYSRAESREAPRPLQPYCVHPGRLECNTGEVRRLMRSARLRDSWSRQPLHRGPKGSRWRCDHVSPPPMGARGARGRSLLCATPASH